MFCVIFPFASVLYIYIYLFFTNYLINVSRINLALYFMSQILLIKVFGLGKYFLKQAFTKKTLAAFSIGIISNDL